VTTWVVDTGPLIFLSKLGRMDLLQIAADLVCVPEAVLEEALVKPDDSTQAIVDATRSWLTVSSPKNKEVAYLLTANLHRGEAEVIALAKEIRADRLVMDDLDARRFARRIGLDLIGTLGLLLSARLSGRISSLRDEIQSLDRLGFRASPALVEAVLKAAGEVSSSL